MEFDPFAGPRLLAAVPSTETQREIWTAAQVSREASCAFNESSSLALTGPLDRDALIVVPLERNALDRFTFVGHALAQPAFVELATSASGRRLNGPPTHRRRNCRLSAVGRRLIRAKP